MTRAKEWIPNPGLGICSLKKSKLLSLLSTSFWNERVEQSDEEQIALHQYLKEHRKHITQKERKERFALFVKKTSDLHEKPKREFPTLFTIKRGHFSNSVEKKVPFYSEKSRDSASLEDTIICSLYQCWMTVLPPSCSWEMERDLGGKLTNFLNGFYSCLNVFFTQQNSTWIKYLGR